MMIRGAHANALPSLFIFNRAPHSRALFCARRHIRRMTALFFAPACGRFYHRNAAGRKSSDHLFEKSVKYCHKIRGQKFYRFSHNRLGYSVIDVRDCAGNSCERIGITSDRYDVANGILEADALAEAHHCRRQTALTRYPIHAPVSPLYFFPCARQIPPLPYIPRP